MSNPTQFRHYLIAQDAQGSNIEIARSAEQVAVLAFDVQRMCFVHCHVLLEVVKNRPAFEQRGRALLESGHPLLARLVEFGEDDGSFFYITENVDGETLAAYLSRMDQLPVWLAMHLTVLCLQALASCLALGDYAPAAGLDSFRVLQAGPLRLSVMLADYRLVEETGGKSARARLAKSSFDKQTQFLTAYVNEQLQGASSAEEALLNAADFQEMLSKLLNAPPPEILKPLLAYSRTVEASMPRTTAQEIAANCKPKPLLANCMASFQEVARSVVQSVRIQSQKLDVSQPYAMRGTLTKSGQTVYVEQVPSRRLAGARPSEAAHQVRMLPKAGKFPNLVPVVFVEENEGLECVAETAVEGVALSDVLAARGALDAQEVYLVLAGLDTALGQTEKAGIGSRRIRLEDIFLFTGFGKDHPRESSLQGSKLNEWPGFSIVLRAHPCMHAMACRGTDPGLLLPIEMKARPDVELLWNGGWMSALGSVLIGMTRGSMPDGGFKDKTTDAVARMFQDELEKVRRNNPSSRGVFLGRYAGVLQEFDKARFQGGPWQELSGSASAQGQAADMARSVAATAGAAVARATTGQTKVSIEPRRSRLSPMGAPGSKPVFNPAPALSSVRTDTDPNGGEPDIGFAELLIAGPADELTTQPEGLRRLSVEVRAVPEDYESSWNSMHEEMPLWLRAVILCVLSMVIGAVLAHLSGHAIWQVRDPRSGPSVAALPTPSHLEKLPASAAPVAKPQLPSFVKTPDRRKAPVIPQVPEKPKTLALPPPANLSLADVDIDHPSARPDPGPSSVIHPPPSTLHTSPAAPAAAIAPSPPAPTLNSQLSIPTPPPLAPAPALGTSPPVPTLKPQPSTTPPVPPRAIPVDSIGPFRDLRARGIPMTASQRVEAEKAAHRGDVDAMVLLGLANLQGKGGPIDPKTAFHWFDAAASANDSEALRLLGECYLQGRGVAADPSLAVKPLEAAAAAGDAESKNLLATCYATGLGVARDDAKAFQLCREAYLAGVVAACGNLGEMYLRGQGTPPDAARAVSYFFEGAKRGHADSMLRYAQALEYGTGVSANEAEARVWYQQAAKSGNVEAANWCRKKGVPY